MSSVVAKKKSLTFQELLFTLQRFWAEHGCVLQQPYDLEVGAGTMSPDTFLRVLGPKPISIAYAQPSRRPADGRYGENPNRLFRHTQLQVILKPPPERIQETVSGVAGRRSASTLREHDIKFEEDNWEWPVGGAWGVGWQVMLDGLGDYAVHLLPAVRRDGPRPHLAARSRMGWNGSRSSCRTWTRSTTSSGRVEAGHGQAQLTYGDMCAWHEEAAVLGVLASTTRTSIRCWKHLELYEAECLAFAEAVQ